MITNNASRPFLFFSWFFFIYNCFTKVRPAQLETSQGSILQSGPIEEREREREKKTKTKTVGNAKHCTGLQSKVKATTHPVLRLVFTIVLYSL